MYNAKVRNVIRYVFPAIFSNVCFFLFTIVDAIFVGRGVGTNALGAINLVSPVIMAVGAVNMLISIGGVSIYAVRYPPLHPAHRLPGAAVRPGRRCGFDGDGGAGTNRHHLPEQTAAGCADSLYRAGGDYADHRFVYGQSDRIVFVDFVPG